MTTLPDDLSLLSRYARTGDSEAFTQLAHRYLSMVYSVGLRVTGSRADAEDVAQESLLDLARNAARVRVNVGGYLHAVATKRGLMLRRGEGRRHARERVRPAHSAADDPATAAEVADAVDAALACLSVADRDLIVRWYLLGHTQPQIAAEQGVDQATVSRRLARAIEAMRRRLGEPAAGADLAGVFASLPSAEPPASLQAMVGRIALSAVGTAGSAGGWLATKAVVAVTAAALLAAGGYYLLSRPRGVPMTTESTPTAVPAGQSVKINPVHLSGFGMVRDSVSVSLEAAAGLLGRGGNYEPLYVLSGNAFAPAIDLGETCGSWWHVQAKLGTTRLPELAASLGLTARKLDLPPLPADATDAQRATVVAAAAGQVRTAMDRGELVISEGGWDEVGAWVWSGIITEVTPEGVLRGSCLSAATGDGKENVAWKHPGGLWAISKAEGGTPDVLAVQVEALRAGVNRIRGVGRYAATDKASFGLPAMDRWILTMQTVRGFCADCFAREPVPGVTSCAADNDKRLHFAAQVVSGQLRTGLAAIPDAARGHLEQAAACYDRIATLLEPGAVGAGGFSWASLTSIPLQRDYARDVLTPIRTEVEWAAVHLERAVAVADGAHLNARLLGPYDRITRESGDPNPLRTNDLARQIAAAAVGREDVSYDELVVLEGQGTVFAYHPTKPFLIYSPPDDPGETANRIARGTGLGWDSRTIKDAEQAWKLVVQGVDGQIPLVASWRDDFFIAGYQDAGVASGRRVYTMGMWSLGQWLTWEEFVDYLQQFGTLSRPIDSVGPRRDLTREVLERIVANAAGDGRSNVGFMADGRFGFDGFEAFAADVENPGRRPQDFDAAWQACHAINRQWHARVSVARWLRRAAERQPTAVAAAMTAAADLYGQSDVLWQQFHVLLSPEPGQTLEAKWTDTDARSRGAGMVREAIDLERQAVGQIESALAGMD